MKISCIIPAYNEAERIGAVLDAVIQCSEIEEIIVVDDFSQDRTVDVVAKYNSVTLIKHSSNKGKSMSIYTGVKKSTGDVLLFLDADLLNLRKEDIRKMLDGFLNGGVDICISLRGNAPFLWRCIGLDYLSGERCFMKSLIEDYLEDIKLLSGFGLEVFLNRLVISKSLKIKIITWPIVKSPLKRIKMGVAFDFLIMGIYVFKEISPREALLQIIVMKKLIV